ncbi:MAG: antitoxin [Candidatus Riflebacteria bacterium]|nr:antitoxin [Candidatus Riflebacteria bacterium]
MKTKWIVILAFAFANTSTFRIEYSSDLNEYETAKEAIEHGFTLNRNDDFNIGKIVDGKLDSVYWMDKKLEESEKTLTKIQEEVAL